MRWRICIALLLFVRVAHGQDSLIQVSAFADVYYAWDFNRPSDRNRSFTTQPYRHNEFNVNWAFLEAKVERQKIRACVALQAGTYVQANYAHEPEIIRSIYEAYAGVRIIKNIWIDAGIMPSYIGEESAVSIDNWNYSRNLSSDYSPYYQSGVQITFQPHDKLLLKGAVTNGFQLIRDNNNSKSVGVLAEYKPNEKIQIGYSNYIGNDMPDDSVTVGAAKYRAEKKIRLLNDFYCRMNLTRNWRISLNAEVNVQEGLGDHDYDEWYALVFKTIYFIHDDFSLAGRLEWFADRDQVLVVTGTQNGFDVRSGTLTLNYYPSGNAVARLEGRWYGSKDAVFPAAEQRLNTESGFVSLSLALRLE